MAYYPEIDGLRAIALILVLLFHVDFPGVEGGFVGVDMFFVISGYIVTNGLKSRLEEDKFSFSSFYSRRALRLAPALFSTLFCTVAVSLLLLPTADIVELCESALSSQFGISNFFFLSKSGYFSSSSLRKPLLHTWSLSVEEQFYIIWPVTLAFILYLRRLLPWARLDIAALSFIFCGSLYSAVIGARKYPSASYFMLFSRSYEFAIGVALNWAPVLSNENLAAVAELLGIICISGSVSLLSSSSDFPSFAALFPCVGTALLLWKREKLPVKFLTTKELVFCGRISYSVYLVHWPIVVLYKVTANIKRFSPQQSIFIASLSLALGYLQYRLVEVRCRHSNEELVESRVGNDGDRHAPVVPEDADKSSFCGIRSVADLRSSGVLGRSKRICLPRLHCVALTGLSLCFSLATCLTTIKYSAKSRDSQAMVLNLDASQESMTAGGLVSPDEVRNAFAQYNKWVRSPEHNVKSTDRPSIVVYGDSHSKAAMPLGQMIAEHLNGSVDRLHAPGCPPLLGVKKVTHRAGKSVIVSDCNARLHEFEKELAMGAPDVAVLAAYWRINVAKPESSDDQRLFRRDGLIPKDSLNSTCDENLSLALFQTSLLRTAELLVSKGSYVIIVGQIPEVYQTPDLCLVRPRPGNIPCTFLSRDEVLQRTNATDRIIVSIGARLGVKGTVVIPSKIFCDPRSAQDSKHCMTKLYGQVIYGDDHHLSALGGTYMALKVLSEQPLLLANLAKSLS